jgi:hypothetical protein
MNTDTTVSSKVKSIPFRNTSMVSANVSKKFTLFPPVSF